MAMNKRGDITDKTPQVEKPGVKTGADKTPAQPKSKDEADSYGDHPTMRASDAVAEQTKTDKK